jgi:hypothetical protein
VVDCIRYQSGYKYQLKGLLIVATGLRPETEAEIDHFVRLKVTGELEIGYGYAWDGPSGPTIDTKNFMRGSLVHDALYQLMREEKLDKTTWRKTADEELVRICRQDGMSRVRSWWVLRAVRWFADPAASPERRKPVKRAPRACVDGQERTR